MDEYQLAQRALGDLRTSVLRLLGRAGRPLSNAEIGHALGIYGGYRGGNEGHISRTVLGMLEREGLVEQDRSGGPWRLTNWAL